MSKVVVFDLGNVLIKWAPEVALASFFETEADMTETLKKIDFGAWNKEQDRGRNWDDAVAIGAAAHPEHAQLFAAYRDQLGPVHETAISGSVEILQQLYDEGAPLYAITNASVRTAEIVHELHDFMSLFRDVVVSGELNVLKPDAEIYRHFLGKHDLAADDCVFIDDSPHNVTGAEAVGMHGLVFTDPGKLAIDLQKHGFLAT